MADLLPRKTYKKVLKGVEHYRLQNEEDRKENPNAIPIDWKSCLIAMVEHKIREDHIRLSRSNMEILCEKVLRYLQEKGLLVPYCGGYSFPTEEVLPTEEEITTKTKAQFKALGL